MRKTRYEDVEHVQQQVRFTGTVNNTAVRNCSAILHRRLDSKCMSQQQRATQISPKKELKRSWDASLIALLRYQMDPIFMHHATRDKLWCMPHYERMRLKNWHNGATLYLTTALKEDNLLLVANLPIQCSQHKAQDNGDKSPDVVVLRSAPVGCVELLQQSNVLRAEGLGVHLLELDSFVGAVLLG